MIKNFTPRVYQETIFASATDKNTLVVLPTGMGKTSIALMMSAHRLKKYPKSKILVLAPTKPLAEQIRKFLHEHLEIEQINLFTGAIAPSIREKKYKESRIIVSTPQTIENDIVSNRISLKEFSLLVVDEAHRATGDYSYVYVAEQYLKRSPFPRILALTASPGSDKETIDEIIQNLGIENIEVRTDNDPDVKPYIQDIKMEWVKIDLPPIFSQIKHYITSFIQDKLREIVKRGYAHETIIKNFTKKDLLALSAKLRAELVTTKDFDAMKSISLAAEAMKMEHALDLLETQGIRPLYQYLQKLESEGYSGSTKASKNLVKDMNFRSALIKTRQLYEQGIVHPKMEALNNIIKDEITRNPNMKIIVFNQYRDNGMLITEELNRIPNIEAKLFVGQAKKNGFSLSQKQQLQIIEEFRQGLFNVLVSSSVGEEGLDIPSVDLVVFFEPVPSAIRYIQRRGRTARLEKGRVIILIAKNTRDEAYRWVSFHKEKKMYRLLKDINRDIALYDNNANNNSRTLLDYNEKRSDPLIYVDHRETMNKVTKQLKELGAEIKLTQLKVGDYIVSNRVGIEFKTKKDFIDSLIDKRILSQASELKNTYARPLIIVEGKEDIYSIRNIHPHAIMGLIAAINVGFGIPIIYTNDEVETAKMIYFIAKREQEEVGKDISLYGIKKPQTIGEQQLSIVASIPGIGPSLAKPLLDHFKTIKNLANAPIEDIEKVEGIGKAKAKRIKQMLGD